MRPELATVLLRVAAPASLPIGLLVSGTLSAVVTRSQSSLFVTAIAWGLVALYQSYTTGFRFRLRDGQSGTRKLCWITGLVFALAQICERVAADGEGVWWTRVSNRGRSSLIRSRTDLSSSPFFRFSRISFSAAASIPSTVRLPP
jgi:hypothetical protein